VAVTLKCRVMSTTISKAEPLLLGIQMTMNINNLGEKTHMLAA